MTEHQPVLSNLFYSKTPDNQVCFFCKYDFPEEFKFFGKNFGTRSLSYLLSITLDKIKASIIKDGTRPDDEKEIMLGCLTDTDVLENHLFHCTHCNAAIEVLDQIRIYKKIRKMVLEDTITMTYNENGEVTRDYDIKLLGLLEKVNQKIVILYKDITETEYVR